MSEETEQDLLTVRHLAHRMNLSESQVYELAKEGQLPFPVIRIGTSVRVSRRAYEDWLKRYDYDPGTESQKDR